MLIGGELNAELERQTEEGRQDEPTGTALSRYQARYQARLTCDRISLPSARLTNLELEGIAGSLTVENEPKDEAHERHAEEERTRPSEEPEERQRDHVSESHIVEPTTKTPTASALCGDNHYHRAG